MIFTHRKNNFLFIFLLAILLVNVIALFLQRHSWPFIQDFSMYGQAPRSFVKFYFKKGSQYQDLTPFINIGFQDRLIKIYHKKSSDPSFDRYAYAREVIGALKRYSVKTSRLSEDFLDPNTMFVIGRFKIILEEDLTYYTPVKNHQNFQEELCLKIKDLSSC